MYIKFGHIILLDVVTLSRNLVILVKQYLILYIVLQHH